MRVWRDAALVVRVCVTRSRLTEERALSRRQLMMVHSPLLRWLARPLLPKGWTASGFKTAGEVDAQRVALRTLGTRLAVVSILSFLCKSASVATSYFARDVIADSALLESIIFLATALAVQAVPSAVTLVLLGRFHFSRGSGGSGALMQSLLTREGVSVAVASDSATAAEVSKLQAELKAKTEQANRLQEEVAQQRAQMATLQQSNQRSQEENAQLRLDSARTSQQVATLMCCVRACAFALTLLAAAAATAAAAVQGITHRCFTVRKHAFVHSAPSLALLALPAQTCQCAHAQQCSCQRSQLPATFTL